VADRGAALRAGRDRRGDGRPGAHGVPDPGRSRDFQAALAALGARHKTIRPHCPWQNGKVERFNRTLATEWAYRQVYASNTERAPPPLLDRVRGV
jgi:transposase InsO family protein